MILEKVLPAIDKRYLDDLLPNPGISNWIEVDAESIANYPDAINQLYKCELDGMVIKGVFSPEELTPAISKLEKKKDGMIPTAFGYLFGYPVDRHDGELQDFQESARWRDEVNNSLGGCFEPRLQALLTKMSGERTVEVWGEDKERKYAPANLRIYQPNKGGLRPHTDREFVEMNDYTGYRLRKFTKSIKCFMSYFLLLKKSESGGDLIVYDCLWEQAPPELKDKSTPEERQVFLDQFQKITITPDVGDIVIFNSRRIWHCISDIKGQNSRMTLGGMISISTDDRQVLYWS